MINIFDFLKDILYKKRGHLLDDHDNLSQFQPYMVMRWISMYSPDTALLLNKTLNRQWSAFQGENDKQMWYKMFLCILPKCNFKKFNYIKRNKEIKKYDPDIKIITKHISSTLEMSQKELNNIISEHNIDVAKYKKYIK